MSRTTPHAHQYFDIQPGHARRPEAAIRWNEGLPAEWQDQVIAPLYFDHYRDYVMAAARILGRDEDDCACYYAHSFVLEEPVRPDSAVCSLAYAESLRAWRLRDGRWLIHRIVIRQGEQNKGRGFYSLSDAMPG
jgi:hypothetical protein